MNQLIEYLMRGGTYGHYWTKDTKTTFWWEASGAPPPVPAQWEGQNCYFGVHPSLVKKGAKNRTELDDIQCINCLYAEFDAKDFDGSKREAANYVLKLKPVPTVVVDSGGGYHCYWLLDNPLVLTSPALRAKIRALQAQWVAAVGGDQGAKDLARVLRIPGTINYKYDPPRKVKIKGQDYSRTYKIEELEILVKVIEDEMPNASCPEELIFEGQGRNTDLASFAGRLRRTGTLREELLVSCRVHTRNHHSPPMEEDEILLVLNSVMRYPPESFLLTRGADDAGNAECIRALFGDKFLYCSVTDWLWYNGKYWVANDRANESLTWATLETLKQRRVAAAKASTEESPYTKLLRAATASRRNVSNAQELLKSLLGVDWLDFDKSPDELNCANGVLDLKTGALTPHSPKQRFTYCLDTEYQAEASDAAWAEFLSEVVEGQTEKDAAKGLLSPLEYIQLAMGYSLTGHTREEVLFYLVGPHRSGKGTFVETLKTLLGGLAWEVAFETFSGTRRAGDQNFDLAPLKNCRFVAASEGKRQTQLSAAFIKRITGGNDVFAAFKHKTPFNYRPKYKIWLSSNYEPYTDPSDNGVWGRLKVIRFPNSFYGKEDKQLKSRLKHKEILEGVLVWLVKGAQMWYSLGYRGLTTPPFIQKTVREARLAADYVAQWAEEHLKRTDDGEGFVASSRYYGSYKNWYGRQGHIRKARGQRTVTADLRRLEYRTSGSEGEKKTGYDKVLGKWSRGVFGVSLVEAGDSEKMHDLNVDLGGVD